MKIGANFYFSNILFICLKNKFEINIFTCVSMPMHDIIPKNAIVVADSPLNLPPLTSRRSLYSLGINVTIFIRIMEEIDVSCLNMTIQNTTANHKQ